MTVRILSRGRMIVLLLAGWQTLSRHSVGVQQQGWLPSGGCYAVLRGTSAGETDISPLARTLAGLAADAGSWSPSLLAGW